VNLDGRMLGVAEILSSRKESPSSASRPSIKFAALTVDPELQGLRNAKNSAQLERFVYGRHAADLLSRQPGAFQQAPGSGRRCCHRSPPRLVFDRVRAGRASRRSYLNRQRGAICGAMPRGGGVASTDIADRILAGATCRCTSIETPGFACPPIRPFDRHDRARHGHRTISLIFASPQGLRTDRPDLALLR